MRQAVIVMGVSGCGKSAVSAGVAEQMGWRAVDADDLHAPDAVAKMRAGTALSDEDRAPWLDRVGAVLAATPAGQGGTVVACSALRRAYRERLRAACPGVCFIFLDGDRAVIEERLARRRDHYMPTALLDSQLKTLERPGADEPDAWRLDIQQPLEALVQQACAAIRRAGAQATHTHQEPAA